MSRMSMILRRFFGKTDKPVGRAADWSALLQIPVTLASFLGLTTAGVMTYLATITDWIAPWGFVGYGAVFIIVLLTVSIVISFIIYMLSAASKRRVESDAISNWEKRVDSFNPMSPDFSRLRIKALDLAHPISKRIEKKQLVDCEILGPANIIISHGSHLNGVGFVDCDVVVTRQKVNLKNCIELTNSKIIGGLIWNCTIFIHPSVIKSIDMEGINYVTLTGVKEIEDRINNSIS